jgi:hypothetical protein
MAAHDAMYKKANITTGRMNLSIEERLITVVANLISSLTPELSRPVAGRRTRASVAYARGRCHDAGSA